MKFSIEILKIVIFLAPGILSMLIIEKLITHKKISIDRFSIYSILLSLFIYLFHYLSWHILYKLFAVVQWSVPKIREPKFILFDFLKNQNLTNISSFIWVFLISLLLSIVIVYFINNKWLNRFGQSINITSKYGDESVWEYFHNAQNKDWVTVRDMKNDIMYFGWISVFSDDGSDLDELILQNVTVYKNSTGEIMYETDKVYIAGKREDFRIEVYNYEKENQDVK